VRSPLLLLVADSTPSPVCFRPSLPQVSSLVTELTEEERIILEYNQRIALFNRAPQDFPSFVRNGTRVCRRDERTTGIVAAVPASLTAPPSTFDSAGYQVRVLTKEGYVEQSDGLIYKVSEETSEKRLGV